MRQVPRASRATASRSTCATSARSSPTSTATCWAAASSAIRRTRRRRTASCACSTRPIRSRSSCEQAGGAASDGTQRILDVQPTELHQRIAALHRLASATSTSPCRRSRALGAGRRLTRGSGEAVNGRTVIGYGGRRRLSVIAIRSTAHPLTVDFPSCPTRAPLPLRHSHRRRSTARDDHRLRARPRRSRAVPVHARRAADDVPRAPVDDAAVRGVRHGAADQRRASGCCSTTGQTGLSRRVRPADADGDRLRFAARARRGRARGRGDRHGRGHARRCSTASRSTRSRRR